MNEGRGCDGWLSWLDPHSQGDTEREYYIARCPYMYIDRTIAGPELAKLKKRGKGVTLKEECGEQWENEKETHWGKKRVREKDR